MQTIPANTSRARYLRNAPQNLLKGLDLLGPAVDLGLHCDVQVLHWIRVTNPAHQRHVSVLPVCACLVRGCVQAQIYKNLACTGLKMQACMRLCLRLCVCMAGGSPGGGSGENPRVLRAPFHVQTERRLLTQITLQGSMATNDAVRHLSVRSVGKC